MKRKVVGTVLFLILFIVSFRFFLFREGGFGHNWDWTFPNEDILYKNFHLLSSYTWGDFNLGGINDLTIVHLIPNVIFGIIGQLIGAKWLVLALFLFIISSAGYGFKRLLDFLIGKSGLNYLPSLLYAFSPFLFNDIIGGSWVMWLSYALIPTYFRLLVSYFREGRVKDLIASLFILVFVIVSLQNFVLANVIVFLFLSFDAILKGRLPVGLLRKVIVFVFCMTLINLYWILPFSYSFANFNQANIVHDGGAAEFNPIRNSHQDIWNIFNQVGYFDRDMYLYALPLFFRWLLHAVTALSLFFIFLYFAKEKDREKIRGSLTWLLSLLLLMFVAKGGNEPFGGLTLALYEFFPPMRMFRSPQHLMLVPAFVLPVLFTYALHFFYDNYRLKRIVVGLSITIILIWISGWWYNGDLGHKTLYRQNRDHVDFYQLAPGLSKYYRGSAVDELNYRSFFLPPTFSPSFRKTKYQSGAQGVQPEYLYLDKPTLTSDRVQFADRVEQSFCKEDALNYLNFLSLFAVADLVVRSDIDPHFTSGKYCWDSYKVERKLDNDLNLSKFIAGEYLAAYRTKDDFFLPLVYTPKTIISTENPVEQIEEIVTRPEYQIRSVTYSEEINLEGIAGEDNIVLEYKKINPTKYLVRVAGAKGKFPLVFSTSFHKGWTIFPGNEFEPLSGAKFISKNFQGTIQNDNLTEGGFYETWSRKPIESAKHISANGYANSWLIDTDKLCPKEMKCRGNNENGYNFEIIIEFLPQKLFYWGLMGSAVAWFGLLIYWLKKNTNR